MLFKDFPIRRKLRAVILLTSGTVLLLTCIAFIAYELLTFRNAARENLSTLAEIMAENSTAALAFRNEEDARKILASLRAELILLAPPCATTTAKCSRKSARTLRQERIRLRRLRKDTALSHRHLIFFHPVQEGDKRFGTIYLESDLRDMHHRIWSYAQITLLVFASSFVIAFFLSNILQKDISQPIISLAQTARAISEKTIILFAPKRRAMTSSDC